MWPSASVSAKRSCMGWMCFIITIWFEGMIRLRGLQPATSEFAGSSLQNRISNVTIWFSGLQRAFFLAPLSARYDVAGSNLQNRILGSITLQFIDPHFCGRITWCTPVSTWTQTAARLHFRSVGNSRTFELTYLEKAPAKRSQPLFDGR